MRRVLALTCLALLAGCGSQDGDLVAEAASTPDQAEAHDTVETEAPDSESLAEMEDDYVEDEGGGEFGDPMSEGEVDLAEASAPMDDAQGIDPHAEMDAEQPSDDY